MMPESTTTFSNTGTISKKRLASSSVQNPITRSTPARLYQLRSKVTTSPAVLEKSAAVQMIDVHLPTTDGQQPRGSLVTPRWKEMDSNF
jgi:hypothetical protein